MSADETFGEEIARIPASIEEDEADRVLGMGKYEAKPNLQDVGRSASEALSPLGRVEAGDISVRLRPVRKEDLADPDVGKPVDTVEDELPPPSGVSAGLGKGVLEIGQNIWNLMNAVDDISFGSVLPGEAGKSPGAISPTTFADDVVVADDFATTAGQAIITFGVPFTLGMKAASALGSSKMGQIAAGAALDAGIGALMTDPTKGRLSDSIVRKYPHMAGTLSLFLTHDDDTYAESLLRSAGEAMTLGIAGGAALLATGKVIRSARKIRAEGQPPVSVPKFLPEKHMTKQELEALVEEKALYDEIMSSVRQGPATLTPATGVKRPQQSRAPYLRQGRVLTEEEIKKVAENRQKAIKKVAENAAKRKSDSGVSLFTLTGDNSFDSEALVLSVISEMGDAIDAGRVGRMTLKEMDDMGYQYLKNNYSEFARILQNHRPGDVYTEAQEVAFMLFARGSFQKTKDLATRVMEYAHIPADELGPRQLFWLTQFQQSMDMFQQAAPIIMGNAERHGRMLRYYQHYHGDAAAKVARTVEGMREYLNIAGSVAGGGDVRGVDGVRLLAQKVSKVSAMHGEATGLKMLSHLVRAGWDMTKALGDLSYSGMMTGTRTFSRAALGGAVVNAYTELSKATGLMVGKVLPEFLGGMPASQWAQERNAIQARWLGMYQSHMAAYENAVQTLQTGKSPYSGIGVDTGRKTRADEWEALGQNSNFFMKALSKGVASFLRATSFTAERTTRLLRSADAYNGKLAASQTYTEMAAREGTQAGLTGEALGNYVSWHAVNPTKQMLREGKKQGLRAAFASDYGDLFGGVKIIADKVQKLDSVISSIPYGKVMVPLMRTGTNGLVNAVESIPGLQLISPRLYQALSAGGPDRYEAMGKIALSTGMLGSIAAMEKAGVLEISGNMPQNMEIYQALKARNPGWQPNSIRVGDKWISHKDIPYLHPLLTAYGTWREYMVNSELDEVGYSATNAFIAAASEAFTMRQLTEDTPRILNAIHAMGTGSPEERSAAYENFVSTYAARVMPLSGIAREATQAVDNIERSRDTGDAGVWDRLKTEWARIIPGASQALPPNRNIFGEIVLNTQYLGASFFSPFQTTDIADDPVSEELKRLGLWNEKLSSSTGDAVLRIALPGKTMSFDLGELGTISFNLTPEERDALIQISAGIGVPNGIWEESAKAFEDSAGKDPELRALYRNYRSYLQAEWLPKDRVVPLKEAYRRIMQKRADPPRGLTDEQLEQFHIAQDNVQRVALRRVTAAYQAMGRAAMWLNRDRLQELTKEINLRKQRWGGN